MANKSVSYVLANVNDKVRTQVTTQMKSRAYRASNELRNAELQVLRGKRSGRVYRVPNTKATYRASAPGEAPASRTGTFRRSWKPNSYAEGTGKNITVHASIESSLRVNGGSYLLGNILEEGTGKMSPRPYKDAIIKKAKPKITKIYKEPYL